MPCMRDMLCNANNSNLSNSGTLPLSEEANAAVYALCGSIVSYGVNADNSVVGFLADSGSIINGSVSTLRNRIDAIIAKRGSTIDASFASATGSTNVALIEDAVQVLTGASSVKPNAWYSGC